jgi:carboxylate-amine ligase
MLNVPDRAAIVLVIPCPIRAVCFALVMSSVDGTTRTVGVEEELLLFTPGARPAPVGEHLAADPDTEVEHEFKLEQAEIASAPTDDLEVLAADLRDRRAEIVDAAAERGVLVAALGTSPAASVPTATPDERYRRMHERYGLVAADQLTCGAHVHVSIGSRAEGVAAIDGVRPWVAVLLALSANSPFWTALDSGYASYRSISWGRWPTSGPTDTFGTEDEYDRRVAELVGTGASIDPAMIYFDVRLSARYPTVEFRMADVGQHVADSVLLAALCRAAVTTAVGAPAVDPPPARLRAAAWRAARFGLSDQLVDVRTGRLRPAADLVDRMLDEFGPALRATGDERLVRGALDALWQRGTGAELQRADLARRGSVGDVVRAAAARTASRTAV